MSKLQRHVTCSTSTNTLAPDHEAPQGGDSMTSKESCLYCKHALLEILPESNAKITFYRCPTCHRQFAQCPDRSLTERWRGPLSLVLYGTIFSQKPQGDAQRIATTFRNQQSRETLADIVTAIRREIAFPSQQVRDILDQSASEKDLRAFLTMVADLLTEEVKEDTVLHTLTGHTSWVRSLAISPDGQTLASGSDDGTIKLWSLSTGQLLYTLTGHAGIVFSVTFNPSGQILASGSQDRIIKLWDLHSRQLLRTLESHTHWVRSLAISPDGQTLVSGSADKTDRLWDLQTGHLLRTFTNHSSAVYSVAMQSDSQIVASGDARGTICVWHAHTGELLHILNGHTEKVLSLAMMNDGQIPVSSNSLISGSADKTIKWWSADDARLISTFTGHTGPVRSVAFNTTWKTIVSSSEDKTIKEWNRFGSQENIRTLPGHSGPVYSLAISPDSRLIASGSLSIKIWGKREPVNEG